mmetsp:Transcript_9904/g.42107  ORF Transcript_9904/g.42107 Transcript_9904/m.42107 type:complete len:423 (-) Transcript_9904:1122-2390(-)
MHAVPPRFRRGRRKSPAHGGGVLSPLPALGRRRDARGRDALVRDRGSRRGRARRRVRGGGFVVRGIARGRTDGPTERRKIEALGGWRDHQHHLARRRLRGRERRRVRTKRTKRVRRDRRGGASRQAARLRAPEHQRAGRAAVARRPAARSAGGRDARERRLEGQLRAHAQRARAQEERARRCRFQLQIYCWRPGHDTRGGSFKRDERSGRDDRTRGAGHGGEVWRSAQSRARGGGAIRRRGVGHAPPRGLRHRGGDPLGRKSRGFRHRGARAPDRAPHARRHALHAPQAGIAEQGHGGGDRRAGRRPRPALLRARVRALPQAHRGRARGRRGREESERQGFRRRRKPRASRAGSRAAKKGGTAEHDSHLRGAGERRVSFVRRHAGCGRVARVGGGDGQARGRDHDGDLPGASGRGRRCSCDH